MSSDVMARVLAFSRKANELEGKGHLLRSAEIFGRAAEAARALGPDNLVTADMQRCQGGAHYNYVVSAGNSAVDPVVITARRADCIALYSAAVATLDRRRGAGTLLEGRCTAAEEAWLKDSMTKAEYEDIWWSPLVGYDVFLCTATKVLLLLENAWFLARCAQRRSLRPSLNTSWMPQP